MQRGEKPFCCDYAKSNRAICRGCQQKIAKDTLRLAIMLPSTTFDSLVPNWYHSACFFIEHMPKTVKDITNYNSLRWDDKKQITNVIERGVPMYDEEMAKEAVAALESKATAGNYSILYCKRAISDCQICKEKITKNQIQISNNITKSKCARYHLTCFTKNRRQIGFLESVSDMKGFEELSDDDKERIKHDLPSISGSVPVASKKQRLSEEHEKLTPEEEVLKQDTDQMHEYRNELQQLTKKQLEELLKYNKQNVYRQNYEQLLDNASDILTYGAVGPCPKCKYGRLIKSGPGYRCLNRNANRADCRGFVRDPFRNVTRVPEELKILFNFLMVYEFTCRDAPKNELAKKTKNEKPPVLNYLNFVVLGYEPDERREICGVIASLGGRVVEKVKRSVIAVVTTKKELESRSQTILQAEECRVYMVPRDYISAVKNMKDPEEAKEIISKYDMSSWGLDLHCRVPAKFQRNPNAAYLYRKREGEEEARRKVVVKSGLAIEPDTGLSDIAHVYQENNDRFTAVLSLTNITRNWNSYYKLQLLEADDQSQYWLYRAWGRIGTDLGSYSVQSMPDLHSAKGKFYELFEEKTGSSWRCRRNMDRRLGKFVFVETDYEANINEIDASKNEENNLESFIASALLHPAVAHVVAMVFNVHAMKQLMLEYSLDTQKMPLGKLSKFQIRQAYLVLNEAIALLPDKNRNKRHITEVSNRFYTLMPYNSALRAPPLLDNMELIKKKLEMLESLYEVETAYCMIQRNSVEDGANILDAYYKQLCADIDVLERSTDEYGILQRYVENTHGPTHGNYVLEILEIFKVNRHEEPERFSKFNGLHNRKLLWHGSRTTNFAGILSQGLRIAPPEAPASGAMFGKGIYFADMVSKSANYCCITETSETREGLLLLCEVALGNICEMNTSCEKMRKLSKNLHSVKGIGRLQPDAASDVTLPDGVTVPLGKTIKNDTLRTSLIYNEYIVYDEAQVRVRYMLKVNFKFKK